MKVYIPFNSNDFNSVFTTLSISPVSYYPNRKYSFKRASATFLNENENFLIGYEKPIFHNREIDKDYGFPILLETSIDNNNFEIIKDKTGVNYIIIDKTIFLFNDFKLIFRREQELNETLAKSLKSIETKYAKIAKENSVVIKEDCFVMDLPNPNLPSKNKELNSNTFLNERIINRIFGVILGSSIAFSNKTSKEWQEISLLLKSLNNNLSLFLNKIGEENDFEKKKSLDIIDEIYSLYESTETLDEAIMLESTITSDVLNSFKKFEIFKTSVYELLIEGILSKSKIDLPILLKIEKLKRAIDSKYSSKYPSNYIKKVTDVFNDIKFTIGKQITLSRKINKLNLDDLIIPEFKNDVLTIKTPEFLNSTDKEYLTSTLLYFIKADNIENIEYFFINRKELLIDIARHFKTSIKGFDKSADRTYLLELLKSFDSLRSGFKISSTNNEVLKSIAILFTSGRDFLKFVENNEKEEILNPIIYYSLWGSIYGAAILPKTTTELITDDRNNLKTLITAFESTLNTYVPSKELSSEGAETFLKSDKTEENIASEPSDVYSKPISVLASKILEILKEKKKVKLADIKSISKKFKTNSDVENLITNEIGETVRVTKEGRTMYAILKEKNELFK
ncbi:hypothetical protein [Aestuariibaculum sediminum]|uniref:Uncharacterized protein n=1 Tax=Aestuariibaculum sediminum TaxID=2770637 RepID=A0A8J6Q7D9_9FLAO|nr:hypothetical protein [Aestuariibaculum sediminum]MBD0831650.1 hypothetical protein [Aestuariibaculum sediminum]